MEKLHLEESLTEATENQLQKWQFEDAMNVVDEAIYQLEDKIYPTIFDNTNIKQARNLLYDSFEQIKELIKNSSALSDEDKEHLIKKYNLEEALTEDRATMFDNEEFAEYDDQAWVGKPLNVFLRGIDHRTRLYVYSEDGYDNYGNYGDIKGLSGLAHDVSWYLADKEIKAIKVPKDKRFYDYKVLIEGQLKESAAADLRDIVNDVLDYFIESGYPEVKPNEWLGCTSWEEVKESINYGALELYECADGLKEILEKDTAATRRLVDRMKGNKKGTILEPDFGPTDDPEYEIYMDMIKDLDYQMKRYAKENIQ